MEFELEQCIQLLSRTPVILRTWFNELPKNWIHERGKDESWSPYDVLGHLIHGERTDWIPRVEIILFEGSRKEFKPFDRFAHLEKSRGKAVNDLLEEFEELRAMNLSKLQGFQLSAADLEKTGIHPELGEVTLRQLLSTWVVHDLNHIGQIAEVMARHYTNEVGPWKAYLDILTE